MAQASQAAPYFDYDWVIERARHYDRLGRYLDLEARFIEELGVWCESGDDLDAAVIAARRINGWLDILVQLHRALQEDMEAYVGEGQAGNRTGTGVRAVDGVDS